MQTYNCTIGFYVRAYVNFDVEAESDEKAQQAAIDKFTDDSLHHASYENDWDNIAMPAIVSLENEDTGASIAEGEDFAQNDMDAQQLASGQMLEALRHCLAFAEYELELRKPSADPEYIEYAQRAVDTARAAIDAATFRKEATHG